MSDIENNHSSEEIRIIHTSDWHLGNSIYKKPELYEDFFRSIEFITNFINNANPKPDFLLHSGDIFQSYPVDSKTRIKCYKLLAKFKIPIYVVRGNHDGPMLSDIEGESCILDELNELGLINYIRFSVMKDKTTGVKIYGVGGYKSNTVNKIYELAKKYPLDKNKINILLAHTITNDYREINPPQKLLNLGFTMINIGHLHEKDNIGSKVFCPGSTNYVSANEWPDFSLNQDKFFKNFYDIRINKKDHELTFYPMDIPVRPCSKIELFFTDGNPEEINQKLNRLISENNFKGGRLTIDLKGNILSGNREEIKSEQMKQLGDKLLSIKIRNYINAFSQIEDIDLEEYDDILRKIIEAYQDKEDILKFENSIDKIIEITSRRKKLNEKDSNDIKDMIKTLIKIRSEA